MFMRCEQAILRNEIARLHGVIDVIEARDAQKDYAIRHLKVENTRLRIENTSLKAVVAAKHVCAECGAQIGKADGEPETTTTKTNITDSIVNPSVDNSNVDVSKKEAGAARLHDGPHTPTSNNSIGGMTRKRKTRKDPKDYKTSGRKPGHKGVTTTREIADTVIHDAPDKCDCGGDCEVLNTFYKQVSDIDYIPKFITKNHGWQTYTCTGCGKEGSTKDQIPSIPGTGFGTNALVVLSRMYREPSSYGSIQRLCTIFGDKFNKGTIINAFTAIGERMIDEVERFARELSGASWMNMDETPISTGRKMGYVWLAHGDTKDGQVILVRAETTRAAAVLVVHFPFLTIPIVCDGYAAWYSSKCVTYS